MLVTSRAACGVRSRRAAPFLCAQPPIRLHDLRHTAASLAYRATRDLKMVSELLGHSGIQITGDIYTSVFEEVDRDAAEAVARLVPRAAPARSSGAVCPQRAHTGPPGRVGQDSGKGETAGQARWGGWGSNLRPRDYESLLRVIARVR
jgi:hypothetical protein